MTEEKVRKLFQIAKYAVIVLFAFFFVLIITQSIIINNKTNQLNSLNSELNSIVQNTKNITKQTNEISSNYSTFAEEELRKQGYAKQGEEVFK